MRRPVSLLLVEPLVDDDLELEAAGAILQDVRGPSPTSCPGTAACSRRSRGSSSSRPSAPTARTRTTSSAPAARGSRSARSCAAARSRQACDRDGRLLIEDSRPVLVGAVVGRTRRALHDADADEIQLTAIAARLGGDAFELDADGRLLGVRPGRPRPRVDLAPLVGRAEELARLRAAFDRVVETGRPVHTVVVGEAGMVRAASSQRSPRTLRPCCSTPHASRTARGSRAVSSRSRSRAAYGSHDVLDQVEERGHRPVHVVEHDDDRAVDGEVLDAACARRRTRHPRSRARRDRGRSRRAPRPDPPAPEGGGTRSPRRTGRRRTGAARLARPRRTLRRAGSCRCRPRRPPPCARAFPSRRRGRTRPGGERARPPGRRAARRPTVGGAGPGGRRGASRRRRPRTRRRRAALRSP